MGDIIEFPGAKKEAKPNVVSISLSQKSDEVIKTYGTKAYLSYEEASKLQIGSEIVVEIIYRKHSATLTRILARDENKNIKIVEYVIPFLNSDDPLKIGQAEFIYKIEKHE